MVHNVISFNAPPLDMIQSKNPKEKRTKKQQEQQQKTPLT